MAATFQTPANPRPVAEARAATMASMSRFPAAWWILLAAAVWGF